jgi:von Willebrand factor type A domain
MSLILRKVRKRLIALPLMLRCFLLAVALHLLSALIFFKFPLIVKAAPSTLFHTALAIKADELKEEQEYLVDQNRKLTDFFKEFAPYTSQVQKPYDLEINAFSSHFYPAAETSDESLRLKNDFSSSFDEDVHAFSMVSSEDETYIPLQHQELFPLIEQKITLEKEPRLNILRDLLATASFEDEMIEDTNFDPSIPSYLTSQFETQEKEGAEILQNMPILSKETSLESLLFQVQEELFARHASPTIPPFDIPKAITSSIKHVMLAASARSVHEKGGVHDLSEFGILEQLALTGWNDYFDIDVEYAQKPGDKNRYLFSVTFMPKFDMIPWKVKQNFYFLIDRSNSIERHRFAVFKKGVLKALSALSEEDHFNICIFDSKLYVLNTEPVKATKEAIRNAEKFLEGQEYKTLFGATDIYEMLSKTISPDLSDDVINTAILISDGGTLLRSKKQQEVIKEWLEKNNHKTALHAATIGKGNNLPLLDLISTCSQGSLMHSDTHAAFPRKLSQMVKELHYPLAKQVVATTIPSDKMSQITLFSTLSRFPYFYCNKPYVISGETDSLSNFTLLLQAKHKDHWITVQKTISFKKESSDIAALEKEFKKWNAHLNYEKFLKEAKPKYLSEAKELLRASGEIAFAD